MTQEQEIKIHELYELGKNDAEIARSINMSSESIRHWRLKNNKDSNFRYKDACKINVDILNKLVLEGKTDKEISIILNVSETGVYGSRKRNNILRESYSENKSIFINQFQKELLIGTLLGDSSLRKEGKNPSFSCEHGISQKDYAFHKYKQLISLGAKYKESTRKTRDVRTNKYYKSSIIRLPANPEFIDIYNTLYINNTKQITKELLKDFSEVSLAYMFMDDGYYNSNGGISICTNCFTKEELNLFINFLYDKFSLKFSIQKRNTIYLSVSQYSKFVSLVFPYLLESMYYKIGLQKISVS